MKTIFVAEIVPSLNKGEAALMHGIVRTIETYCDDDVEFYLCSEIPEQDQIEYGDKVKVVADKGLVPVGGSARQKLLLFSWFLFKHLSFLVFYRLFGRFSLVVFRNRLWEAYARSDVIIVGHDNAFSKFHLPLILYSKLLGKKVAVYGCTIMPVVINSPFLKILGKYALNKVDLITTRELLTYKHLKSFGVDKVPLYCTADKAFILKPVDVDEGRSLINRYGLDKLDKPVFGVMIVKGSTVFKAAFKGQDLSPDEKYDKHILQIAETLDIVHEKTGGNFVFMPHCIGPGEDLDDRVCARDVQKKMKNKDVSILLEDELRVTELKAMMAAFDMVISERTHGGINAATMLVPTLWVTHPNDHRTYGIVTDTLKLPECLYNIEDLKSSTLSEKILDIYGSRDHVNSELQQHVPEAEKMTMSNGEYFKKHVLDKLP